MSENKYIVSSTPEIKGSNSSSRGLKNVTADPRSQSNIEAEVGETMVTHDNISNQRKLMGIGGKKHSEGGTPLNVPEGTAIYSDSLKIKDPNILKFFNENGKKPKTFADISKKYDITKLQEERKNEDNDVITNDSIDKSLDNHNFKLSALFTMQEFHEKKGAPEEHSKHFEAFMERMGISYEDIFGNDQATPMMGEMQKGKQGMEVKFDQFPVATGRTLKKFDEGGEKHKAITLPPYDESNAYGKQGVERLNTYLKSYSLGELDVSNTSRSAIQGKIKQLQAEAVRQNPDLIFDYMTTDLDPTDNVYKSHRPNEKLQEIMRKANSSIEPSADDGTYTNEDLKKMLDNKSLNTDNVLEAYQDNKWWYRMVNSDIKTITQEEMDAKKELLDTQGITQGDYKYLHMGDGYYEAYRVKPDGSIEQVEPDKAIVDKIHKWDVDHIDDTPAKRDDDFLWANKRSLGRARQAAREIPYLEPFTAIPETEFVDQAYYDPAQAINAVQSMTADATTKQAMFSPQQQQAANFMAVQQADAVAKVIGNYADRNVAAYNQEQLMNTQIANRANERLSSAIQGHHDKNTMLKQSYANSMTQANNNIAAHEIAMWQERADRLNLESTVGEQYAINPDTGIMEFQGGRKLTPKSGTQTTVADRFNDLKNQMPGVDDSVVAKMAMAMHSGKYNVDFDEHPQKAQQYQ
jgi:hypothetical protein